MELKNSSLFKEKGFINGKWVSAENGKTYDVTNPADNSLVAKVFYEKHRGFQAAYEESTIQAIIWSSK